MKRKITLSALACGIMMLLASCAGSAIKMAADGLDSSCPKQINDYSVLSSTKLKRFLQKAHFQARFFTKSPIIMRKKRHYGQ